MAGIWWYKLILNTMRKVKFNKWITSTWLNVETGEEKQYHQNPGLLDTSTKWKYIKAGHFESDFKNDGLFHSFGFESQDNGDQMVMDSVAIIEEPDGSVLMVAPHRIKFVD